MVALKAGHVRLLSGIPPVARKPRALLHLTQQVRDLALAVAGDVDGSSSTRNSEFREIADVTPEEAVLFQRVYRTRISLLMESLDAWIASQRKLRGRARNNARATTRISMGAFLWAEALSSEPRGHRTRRS